MQKEFIPPQEKPEARIATVADAADIARIQHESWLATYPSEKAGITREDIAEHLGIVDDRAQRCANRLNLEAKDIDFIGATYVLEIGGRVVGFCKVARGMHTGHVDALYLDPAFAQKGFGGELFQKGLQWLGDEAPIDLEVASYNDRAIHFYERFGFRKQDKAKPLELLGGKFLPLTLMVRDVVEK